MQIHPCKEPSPGKVGFLTPLVFRHRLFEGVSFSDTQGQPHKGSVWVLPFLPLLKGFEVHYKVATGCQYHGPMVCIVEMGSSEQLEDTQQEVSATHLQMHNHP